MPEQVRHRPPSLKLAHDDAQNEVILQIVSPINPSSMSQNMKQTMRMSESIKRQQSSIIAAKNNSPTQDSSSDSDSTKPAKPVTVAPKQEPNPDQPSSGSVKTNSTGNTAANSAANSAVSSASSTSTSAVYPANVKDDTPSSPVSAPCTSARSSPGPSSSVDRVSSVHRRSLKRRRTPKPLNLTQHASVGTGPYTAAVGYPGMYSAQMNGFQSAPLRPYFPGVPRMVHHIRARPQRVPMGLPYTIVQTPYARNMPMLPERRAAPMPIPKVSMPSIKQNVSVREPPQATRVASPPATHPTLHSSKRMCPVQDVFVGNVRKVAPLPSQPPSAQREKFSHAASDDREAATEEEMEEMRRKREEGEEIFGSMSFMDKSTFRFKILNKNLSSDERKAKFMKICETTWDEFMKEKLPARQT